MRGPTLWLTGTRGVVQQCVVITCTKPFCGGCPEATRCGWRKRLTGARLTEIPMALDEEKTNGVVIPLFVCSVVDSAPPLVLRLGIAWHHITSVADVDQKTEETVVGPMRI